MFLVALALALIVLAVIVVLVVGQGRSEPIVAPDAFPDPDAHFKTWYTAELLRQRQLGFRDTYLYGDLCLNGEEGPSIRIMDFELQPDGTFVSYTRPSGKVAALQANPYGTLFYLFRHPASDIRARTIEIRCRWEVISQGPNVYKLIGSPLSFTFTEANIGKQIAYIQRYEGPAPWKKLPIEAYSYDFQSRLDSLPLHPRG